MIQGFVAKKISMDSLFTPQGKKISVTILKTAPLKVSRIITKEKNGYDSLVLSIGKKLQEFSHNFETLPEVGSEITISQVLAEGDQVNVSGKSKGHGFAGVIKRYGFHRQPVTGGQSDRVRAPGSIGAQTPGKVVRGKKMPGHYGNKNKTVTHLKVIKVDSEKNLLYVSGSVPGSRNTWITLLKK